MGRRGQAQYTGSTQTNTISGVTSNWSGTYVIGSNTWHHDVLLIKNNGKLTTTAGYLGYASANSNNTALVTGAGSVWSNANNLYVGYASAGNRLTISNSGTVWAGNSGLGVIGNAASAVSNAVLVTGAGSRWVSYNLYVGSNSFGNQLTIANGGTTSNDYASIGYTAGASNNAALVTGAGSFWNVYAGLVVGGDGAGNTLTIANGGTASNGYAYIGTGNAGNNAALVTGAGSVWGIRGGLAVGFLGAGNSLTITDGGTVRNGSDASIGYIVGASNNAALVTGAGSVWSVGSRFYVGYSGSGNTLTLLDGGHLVSSESTIGSTAWAHNNQVLVSGPGSVWSNAYSLSVGYEGSGNSLTITNGGQVQNQGAATIGGAGSNNTVLVTGVGSVWNNAQDFSVYGSGNTLTIANGGAVSNSAWNRGAVIDGDHSAATVTGAGSVWNSAGALTVGFSGSGNTLTIANGGAVVSDGDWLEGEQGGNGIGTGGGTNNAVIVTGSGSTWTSRNNAFRVGCFGSGNTLLLTNGGAMVVSDQSYIGGQPYCSGYAGDSNAVTVTGTGSSWRSGQLFVGCSGAGNTLTIANGGAVVSGGSTIGFADPNGWGGDSNAVTVTGPGAIWNNSGALSIGDGSYGYSGSLNGASGNSLLISQGGTVVSGGASIGNCGNNNAVTVNGADSIWTNKSELYVGYMGSGNTLTLADRGAVFNTAGYIGNAAGSDSNAVLVTGSNSVWNNSGDLFVGYSGSGNTLTMAQGGRVFNGNAYIGLSSNNNAVTVTGAGSVWNNSGDLLVGLYGSGNSLTLTNGGTVANGHGILGAANGADNNAVTVTGAGSLWTNSGDLYVGQNGCGNSLTISSGGTVANANGNIGYYSNNNAVAVTGPGSVWNNRGDLVVGSDGSGNRLTIANGGTVFAQSVTVGAYADSSNNVLALSGAGSSLFTTNAGSGTLDIRGGAVTMDGGTIQANSLLANNGANGTFQMSGGTLAVNTIVNDGSANLVLAGGTLQPLNTDASWAANLALSNAATSFDTRDAGGQARLLNISGVLSGDGGLNLVGDGAVDLSGLNTYSGATTVSNATLKVNGALNVNGAVSVYRGATFGGTGAVGRLTLFEGGTYSPGNSPGTQTVAGLHFAGGTFDVELIDAGLADQVIAQGGLGLSATATNHLHLSLANFDAATAIGTTFVIARNDSGLTWDGNTFCLADAGGAQDGAALLNRAVFGVLGGGAAEQYFQIRYDYTAAGGDGLGNDIALTLTTIPEPGSLGLGALALGGAYLLRYRGRRKKYRWKV